MGITATERLRRFYEQFSSDDQVLILINADPDAIAGAMAVKRLLWRKVAQVVITHVNIIKRPDNLAMIRLLGVNMTFIREINRERFNRFVLIDSQPGHHVDFAGFNFDVIIDHHPDTQPKAKFVDIRPKFGATATILTEYLRTAKIKPSAKLSAGLFYAIKTDTRDFEQHAIMEDVRAFQFLFRHANLYLARRFEQADLRLDFLKYFQMALERKCIRKSRVYVYLGQVVNPDICVIVADFFMRINSINWSIVTGSYEKKMIIIVRNDGFRRDAGQMVRASFGQLGSAGGHKSMARAEIPFEALTDKIDVENDKLVLQWVISRVEANSSKRNKRPDGNDKER